VLQPSCKKHGNRGPSYFHSLYSNKEKMVLKSFEVIFRIARLFSSSKMRMKFFPIQDPRTWYEGSCILVGELYLVSSPQMSYNMVWMCNRLGQLKLLKGSSDPDPLQVRPLHHPDTFIYVIVKTKKATLSLKKIITYF